MATCYQPLQAWQPLSGGKPVFGSRPPRGFPTKSIKIACGQCQGCLSNRSDEWSIRMMHEASLYDYNQFATLTYDDENLPADNGLHHKHYQDFMKRLRSYYKRKYGHQNIRFVMSGEYGDTTYRPHYHVILFNLQLLDLIQTGQNGKNKYFGSEILTKLWGHGSVTLGEAVTLATCKYVANYILKQSSDDTWKMHNAQIDPETGELTEKKKPYNKMSNKPGIGYDWLKKFESDCYPSDKITYNGRKSSVPKYYNRKYKENNEDDYNQIVEKREQKMKTEQYKYNSTPERLKVREKVHEARIKNFKRDAV